MSKEWEERLRVERARAYNQGVQATLEEFLDQQKAEYAEFLRAMAWRKTGARISFDFFGTPENVPEGWPEGVDGEALVEDRLNKLFPTPTEDNTPPPEEDEPPLTPSVKNFRDRLN